MGMEQLLQLSLLEEGNKSSCVVVEINAQATVQNLIWAYCAQRGIPQNPQLTVYDTAKKPLSPYATIHSAGIENKQTLMVGHMKNNTIRANKGLLILACLGITLGFAGILAMSIAYSKSGGVYPFNFGVVMDAGSTKTNSILYWWAGDKFKGTGCVRQNKSCSTSGGIAKQANISYFLPCLSKMSDIIPEETRPTTQLYFVATAGMRLLNISDPGRASSLLSSLHGVLNETGLSLNTVEIISGKDEGLYAWITTNFLKETLLKEEVRNPWSTQTLGSLDMGGASMQISFAIDPAGTEDNSTSTLDPAGTEENSTSTLTLYGHKFQVYASSSLCFGRDEASNRHSALLLKDPRTMMEVDDPCLPTGYKEVKKGSVVFGQPCTQSKNSQAWIKEGLGEKNFTFRGTSDYATCAKQMKAILNKSECEKDGFRNCFQEIKHSWGEQRFMAFSSYFYTAKGLKILNSSLPEYLKAVQDYCTKPYSEIKPNDTYALQYCFSGCYISQVLTSSYGFNETTWKNLNFIDKVDEKDLGWTLGYMINATNAIKEMDPSPKFTTMGILAICLIIFMAMVITAITFIVCSYCGKQRNAQGSHQALFRNP